jgi:trehalose-6-phosphatase
VRINDEAHFFSFQVAGCNATAVAEVRAIAAEVVAAATPPGTPPLLHVRELKGVVEVRPAAALRWDKGAATSHLLQAAGLAGRPDITVIAVGDDVSDEATFSAALGAGCGAAAAVAVGTPSWPSAAMHAVAEPKGVEALLAAAVAWGAVRG